MDQFVYYFVPKWVDWSDPRACEFQVDLVCREKMMLMDSGPVRLCRSAHDPMVSENT